MQSLLIRFQTFVWLHNFLTVRSHLMTHPAHRADLDETMTHHQLASVLQLIHRHTRSRDKPVQSFLRQPFFWRGLKKATTWSAPWTRRRQQPTTPKNTSHFLLQLRNIFFENVSQTTTLYIRQPDEGLTCLFPFLSHKSFCTIKLATITCTWSSGKTLEYRNTLISPGQLLHDDFESVSFKS